MEARQDRNVIRRLAHWLITLPIRYAFVVLGAYIILLLWNIWHIEDFSSREASVIALRDSIKAEIVHEMPKVLTPAQYQFATTHLVSWITDVMADAVDELFVRMGSEPSTAQLAAFVAMQEAFRLTASMFIWMTAALMLVVGMCMGRYHFYLAWRQSKVVEVSSTWFAYVWQSRVLAPMMLFTYLASPWPAYRLYALCIIGWAGLSGYITARSFSDHI